MFHAANRKENCTHGKITGDTHPPEISPPPPKISPPPGLIEHSIEISPPGTNYGGGGWFIVPMGEGEGGEVEALDATMWLR